MENWRENLSIISKLKVAENPADALATRLFFERLFAAANFHPLGISQKAIVCIKKINAPPVKNNRFTNSAFEWEKSVRSAVENLYRRAFRPLREIVPAQAESVIFENESELLACLARDWCRGVLAENWWWHAIFPNLTRAGTVAKIWLERAEFAPVALQILSKTGDAQKFVKKLQPEETIELMRKIIRLFGLDRLEAALFRPVGKKEKTIFEKHLRSAEKSAFGENANLTIPAKFNSFFANLLPEIKTADLSFHQQCLLETGLLLARSPRAARSPEFAARIKTYRITSDFRKTISGGKFAAALDKKKTFNQGVGIKLKSTRNSPVKNDFRTIQIEPKKTEKPGFIESKKRERKIEKRQIRRGKSPRLTDQSPTGPGKIKESEKSSKIIFETPQAEKSIEKIEPKEIGKREEFIKTAVAKETFENFSEDFETAIEYSFQTRFGGVFYLLNLGLYLGLYRDFTESLTTEIDLNIWDFVALLGLEFLGGQIKKDEVWDFLKFAAERESDREFGAGFNQSQDWRVPPAWLETFPQNRKWLFRETKKRLVIRHPEGFNVADVARRGAAEIQLKNELKIYEEYFSGITEGGKANSPPVKSKKRLKNLTEYLQKRLFQALNLQTAEELNAVLFARQAEVAVSATHLEITFGLADLPFEVRLAGIDRNPGWIPAAGKFVYFHFV